ncbi:cytoplasmic phosphatidylinositol transfer protein 1 [Chrysemys picta bellii]|uniref:cytoplasmic phosphatidylinositol transfer protein 1 n=1 Tax=Chrysemys picta bellii TaxID=8478 RepID=UPI0032B294B7
MRPSDRSAPSSAIPPPARLRAASPARPQTHTGNQQGHPLRQQRGQPTGGRTPQALAETPHSSCRTLPGGEEEYRIGQLYMISKHSHEQSDRGEGVEVVQNEPYEDPNHGNGQLTEKRVYLNSKLPSWARAVVPKIFYITEKAWNYYPYTITEYTCSFLPKFSIHIETKYEDNKGSNDNIFDNEAKDLEREVCFIDIACDEIPERYYKESEDPKHFKSEKTGRGLLKEGWRETHQPIMCSYKLVTVKFEVWGLQTRVEQFVHKVVRDILMIGHRQAFAWVDEWYDMTMDDVREFEKNMHEKTNIKVCNQHSSTVDEIESHAKSST